MASPLQFPDLTVFNRRRFAFPLGLGPAATRHPHQHFHFHRLHHRVVADPLLKPTGVSETRPLVQKDEMRTDDGKAELVLLKTAQPSRPCSALSARNNKRSRRNPAPQIGRARDKASVRCSFSEFGLSTKNEFPRDLLLLHGVWCRLYRPESGLPICTPTRPSWSGLPSYLT